MIITLAKTDKVQAGWVAIIKATDVTVEATAAASFSLSRTIGNTDLVYVVVLEAATGNKLTGEVEVKAYSEAKPEGQPGGPSTPDGPGEPEGPDQGDQGPDPTPASVTVTATLAGSVSGWTLKNATATAKAGEDVTFVLEQASASDLGEDATVAVTLSTGSVKDAAVTTAGVASSSTKAEITVTYTIPSKTEGETATIEIASVTATPAGNGG